MFACVYICIYELLLYPTFFFYTENARMYVCIIRYVFIWSHYTEQVGGKGSRQSGYGTMV